MAKTWQVVRSRNGRESVLFDGTEADARKFISDNFPRVHVEPGSPDEPTPDALLKSATGTYSAFHGPETGFVDTDKDGTPKQKGRKSDDEDNDNKKAPAFGGSK